MAYRQDDLVAELAELRRANQQLQGDVVQAQEDRARLQVSDLVLALQH